MESHLTQELKKAYDVLQSNIQNWKKLQITSIDKDKLIPTGFVAFSLNPFDKLPRREEWTWSQSNAKTVIPFVDGGKITIVKKNTRKIKNVEENSIIPSYKIWIFCIQESIFCKDDLYFIWCEKGEQTEIEPPKLGDLAFLCEHIDPNVAKELGWEDKN